MNLNLRYLCAAAVSVATPFIAQADDFYLNCVQHKQITDLTQLCPNFESDYRELLKFTPTDVKNEYQLAVEHICSNILIDCVDENGKTVQLGSASGTIQHMIKEQCESDAGQTFNLVKASDCGEILNNENYYGNSGNLNIENVEHVLLTLTVDDDGQAASLKIEHITNSKLKKGVPSFFYIITDEESFAHVSTLLEAPRFVKADGDYYIATADNIEGRVYICDGLVHSWWNTCLVFCASDFTEDSYIEVEDYYHESGKRPVLVDNTDNKIEVLEKNENGFFTLEKHMFQDPFSFNTLTFNVAAYDVTFLFKYDIASASQKTDSDGNSYNYSDNPEYIKTDDNVYNGVLTFVYGINQDHYAVTLSNDQYDPTKCIVMNPVGDGEIQTDGNMFYYEYECTVPGDAFNGGFYINGYDGETLSSSSVVIKYAGDPKETKYLVKNYTFTDGSGYTSDVIDFYYGHNTSNAIVNNSDTAIPFYALNTSETTIKFRYNINEPSASKVIVQIDNAKLTGAESIAVDTDNAPAEYFNLNGVPVDAKVPGLYIRRQGNKVSKVVVK